eukprot:3138500-Pyramimonas_sp.AAC.1
MLVVDSTSPAPESRPWGPTRGAVDVRRHGLRPRGTRNEATRGRPSRTEASVGPVPPTGGLVAKS